MRGFIKKHRATIILVVILAVGVGIMLYPTVSDWWNSFHQSRAIASYQETVEELTAEEKAAMLQAAHEYNERIAKKGINFNITDEERAEYEKLLDVSGTGIMGYIQIPSISVNLPIYHSVDETVLQVAIGHLAGSSLPVGGENTHASVSGHRGLPSARLFTDIDQLEEGDIFTITVLDETIAYKVDQIRIVLPEETSELMIKQGEDYCTLITCTPYGVNSHRMLVRGTRTDYVPDMLSESDAVKIPAYLVIPAVGIPLLFIMLLILLLSNRRRAARLTGREMLEEYRKNRNEADKIQEETTVDSGEEKENEKRE